MINTPSLTSRLPPTVKDNDATMLTDTKGVMPPDRVRRTLLKATALATGAALASNVLPLAFASPTRPPTSDISPTVMVDGWLLRADDR